MIQAAKEEGINLTVTSAYRSAEVQAGILADNMMRSERGGFSAAQRQAWMEAYTKLGGVEARRAKYQGRTWEDWFTNTPNGNSIRSWIALPGSSQHQKGRAVDFGNEAGSLVRQGSKEAIWLKQNAAKYGVHIPLGNEPWQAEPIGSRDGSMEDRVTSVSNNKIGDSLGVDFATYERDAGLPEGYLEAMAYIESGGRPNARREGSQYIGLFQLGKAVRNKYGVKDPLDPDQNTRGAVALAKDNMRGLRNVLGRDPTGPELYLAHQQGLGGATALLKNPDMTAVDALATIMDRGDAEKHILANAGKLDMTASEFADIWVRKFQDRGQFAGSGQANADGPGGDANAPVNMPETSTPISRGEFELKGTDSEADPSNRQAAVEAGNDLGLSEDAVVEAARQAIEGDQAAEKDKAVAQQQEAQAVARMTQDDFKLMGKRNRDLVAKAGGTEDNTYVVESNAVLKDVKDNGELAPGDVVYLKEEKIVIVMTEEMLE